MINNLDFAKRLQLVIKYYQLSASSFADKIGVQRSSISHLLSGRNKPSLDFVLKVLETFHEVELYWLLNGKGSFPNTSTSTAYPKISTPPSSLSKDKEIDKIIVFYKDGTFQSYFQQE